VFGPSVKAARMEGSKTFSKDFMKKHNIPTAAYENFTDAAKAKEFIQKNDFNVVLKASGLAAGKGVLIPTTKEEACQGVDQILVDKVFGAAGMCCVFFLFRLIWSSYRWGGGIGEAGPIDQNSRPTDRPIDHYRQFIDDRQSEIQRVHTHTRTTTGDDSIERRKSKLLKKVEDNLDLRKAQKDELEKAHSHSSKKCGDSLNR
jgi:hypothetical protein